MHINSIANIDKLYDKINNKTHFVVFGLSTCVFCKETINLLENNKLKYKYYLIDDYYNIFFKTLVNLSQKYPFLNIDSSHKTVPVIFYSKRFIGGFTDLNKMFNH